MMVVILPIAGQRALAILAFAVILWVTEAVSYPVSSAMIVGLIAVLLGLAPSIDDPTTDFRNRRCAKNGAWWL